MLSEARVFLSLVVPVYNCESWIVPRIAEVLEYLDDRPEICELIIVDDGSSDATGSRLAEFIAHRSGVTLIRLPRNVGKGGAVRQGMRETRGRYCVFTDCDLAYPLTEIDTLLERLIGGADVVIANRRATNSVAEVRTATLDQANRRERNGRILNNVLRRLGLTCVEDTQAGLKGFRREAVHIFEYLTVTRFAFDIELLVIAAEQGFTIESVPVRYRLADDPSTVNAVRDGLQLSLSALQIARNRSLGVYLLDSLAAHRRRMVITPGVAMPRRKVG